MNSLKTVFFCISVGICLLLATKNTYGQKVYVNTNNQVYELTGGVGSCTYKLIDNFCNNISNTIFSSALYNQTFYFLAGATATDLYAVNLSQPGSCKLLTKFPNSSGQASLNSMTVDKNGNIYIADGLSSELFFYKTSANTITRLGILPAPPSGDLIFYKGKLLYAAVNGIYEINLSNVSASKLYMTTAGYIFWGMISFPYKCDANKIYGLATIGSGTTLVEMDLENKVIVGETCNLPFAVFDAASSVEDGNTIGVTINSISITPPCIGSLTTDMQVNASTAKNEPLTYYLDNASNNKDGSFKNIGLGAHEIKVMNESGCEADSIIIVKPALAGPITITSTKPQSCDLQNGTIQINAVSNYGALKYSINNSTPSTLNTFNNLKSGSYKLSVYYGNNCQWDTSIVLNYVVTPVYFSSIISAPTTCEKKSGSISVIVPAGVTDVTAAINNGTPQKSLVFNNLDEGKYNISIFKKGDCEYDTVVTVEKLTDPKPGIILVTKDQFCYINNGEVTINAIGNAAPFTFSFNNAAFTSNAHYTKLAPGTYPVAIRNNNLCKWDTSAIIQPYTSAPVTYSYSKTDVDCKVMNDGTITMLATGDDAPYLFQYNDDISSSTFSNLAPGNYAIKIINNDNCVVDTAHVTLNVIPDPACDNIHIPNAFTPNGDSQNDNFGPIITSYITSIRFVIFNRFGQEIFNSDSQNPKWDGTFQGYRQPSALYTYIYTYKTYLNEIKTVKGIVHLIR